MYGREQHGYLLGWLGIYRELQLQAPKHPITCFSFDFSERIYTETNEWNCAYIMKFIILDGNSSVSIPMLLKCVLWGPLDDKFLLVQITAWHQTGDEPLPEPTMA